ncbi:MAG: acyl-CoA thioesterase [Bdellovibrionaceae bacterium]|nr:acyl-CoA thioesterase [Pseudobdellovibrionaceae bacterium]
MSETAPFAFHRRVQFYETDLMRIVHHSNYLRFYEEARVAWAAERGVIDWKDPQSAAAFAVLGTQVRHLAPCRFGDQLKIEVQVRLNGVRVVFEYKMWNDGVLASEARTEHVNLGPDLRPQRPLPELKACMEKETWKETWLSSL